MKGGSVLSVGQSKLRTNPANCDFDVPGTRERVSEHAEMAALRRCGNPKGASLFVARIGRNGKVAMAKPCSRCRDSLIEAGIKKVFYTVLPEKFETWP